MLIKGQIKFKEAITVTPEFLKDISEVICIYYNYVSYKANLKNNDIIMFESLDELIKYDNFNDNKLATLSIYSDIKLNLEFETTSSTLHKYNYTLHGNYSMNSMDDSILFKKKLDDILKKRAEAKFYTFISKISMVYGLIIVVALCVLGSLYCSILGISTNGEISIFDYIISWFLSMVGVVTFSKIFNKFQSVYFPPIVFYWGEEIQNYDKIKQLRKNVFWGVIVTLLVSLLVSLIL
ncbi:MAG: hypothetical protein ACERKZ_03320 [Lachnotalea sp.]